MKTLLLEINIKDKTVKKTATFESTYYAKLACDHFNVLKNKDWFKGNKDLFYSWSEKSLEDYATFYDYLIVE